LNIAGDKIGAIDTKQQQREKASDHNSLNHRRLRCRHAV
jgi:hypothetical protein